MDSFVYLHFMTVFLKDWTPVMNTESVCRSIVSMLSSAKKKQKPANDEGSIIRY